MKYIFTKNQDINNKFDHTKVQIESDAETLSEILEAFEYFLKGSGFVFEGHLDIVNDSTEKEVE